MGKFGFYKSKFPPNGVVSMQRPPRGNEIIVVVVVVVVVECYCFLIVIMVDVPEGCV